MGRWDCQTRDRPVGPAGHRPDREEIEVPRSTSPGTALVERARLVRVGRPTPYAEPMDIRITGNRVAAVAPRLAPRAGELVLHADGRWAIPGLWDQHVHLLSWAQTRTRLDLSGSSGPNDVVARVAQHLGPGPDLPAGSWVFGHGYRSATWADPPTVAQLDAVSGDHPVALTSGDGHNGWLNSRALAALGARPAAGALREGEWFALAPALAALATGPDDDALRSAVTDAASRGVVGIVDLELTSSYLDWPERFARGIDALRVRAAVYPDRLEDAVSAGLRTGQPLVDSGLATMGPLKIISDGSLNTRTAFCTEPYADGEGLGSPRGQQNYDRRQLQELLGQARDSGLEVALHVIGDAAVTYALDAFAVTGARGSIEHAQLMHRSDIDRMGELGIRASVQPAHLLDDRDVTARCWPDRADRCFPFRSLLTAGVPLVFGSDAPVAPLDPWLAMAAAVHRSGDQRPPWNPAEALTAAEALAASTDGETTVAPGSRGDLVLLDADPLLPVGDSAAVAARLRSLRVAATLVAGRLIHSTL
ncbi:MAG: amidohydrolase [Actinomycetes bacterium]